VNFKTNQQELAYNRVIQKNCIKFNAPSFCNLSP